MSRASEFAARRPKDLEIGRLKIAYVTPGGALCVKDIGNDAVEMEADMALRLAEWIQATFGRGPGAPAPGRCGHAKDVHSTRTVPGFQPEWLCLGSNECPCREVCWEPAPAGGIVGTPGALDRGGFPAPEG
mgnify:CR=1 FL=1